MEEVRNVRAILVAKTGVDRGAALVPIGKPTHPATTDLDMRDGGDGALIESEGVFCCLLVKGGGKTRPCPQLNN